MLHYVIRPYDNLAVSLGNIYTCTKRWNNVATICINVTEML